MDVNPAALLIATNLFNQRVLIEAAAVDWKGRFSHSVLSAGT
jgi:hypothetical protein